LKLEWNKRYTLIAVYTALVIAFAVILIFIFARWDTFVSVLKTVLSVAKPLMYAVGIAYILWPIVHIFEAKLFSPLEKKRPRAKLVRSLSLICTYVIFLSLLSLFIGTIIPQITDSLMTLQSRMYNYISNAQTWLYDFLSNTNIPNTEFLYDLMGKLNQLINSVVAWLYDNLKLVFSNITSYAASFATEMKNILLGIVFSVYFLLFKEHLLAQIKKFFMAFFPDHIYQKLAHYAVVTDHTFGGFISGKIFDSLIIGLLCFILMTIFRMPYAPLISMIVGITNIIPFFGPFIGAIPSAFIILVADPGMTIWFILMIFALQQLDGNVIGPKILGDFIGLTPLWIIVSITLMGGLFGVFGMFLGVPTFAVIYIFVKEITEKNLQKKELPIETVSYYGDERYLAIINKSDAAKPSLFQTIRRKLSRKKNNEKA